MHKNYMKMNKFAIIIFTNTWLHFLSAEKFGQNHGYSLPEVGMFSRNGTAAGITSTTHDGCFVMGFSSITPSEEAPSLKRQN